MLHLGLDTGIEEKLMDRVWHKKVPGYKICAIPSSHLQNLVTGSATNQGKELRTENEGPPRARRVNDTGTMGHDGTAPGTGGVDLCGRLSSRSCPACVGALIFMELGA